MKKVFCFILILAAIIAMPAVSSFAEGGVNWYVRRCGNQKPDIPKEHLAAMDAGAYYVGEGEEKVIYLTFDAGYENGNVEKCVDILKDKGVSGAFFVLKHILCKNSDLIKKMYDNGNLICNHTTNHCDMSAMSSDEIISNVLSLEKLCFERCGVEMSKFFRFPEGRYSTDAINAVAKAGYKTVFWSFGYADWDNHRQPSAESAYDLIIKNTHPGEVILLHPTSETNVKILPQLIDAWRDMGYRFGTLDELCV